MADVPQHRLLVIEDGTLQGMLGNPAVMALVPMLNNLKNAPRPRSCGSCGGGASFQKRAAVYQQVKQAIAALPSERKAELKRLLNAHQMRVLFRTTDGRTIQLTF